MKYSILSLEFVPGNSIQAPTVAETAAVIAEHQGEKLGKREMEGILTELESLTDEEATQLLAEKRQNRAQARLR